MILNRSSVTAIHCLYNIIQRDAVLVENTHEQLLPFPLCPRSSSGSACRIIIGGHEVDAYRHFRKSDILFFQLVLLHGKCGSKFFALIKLLYATMNCTTGSIGRWVLLILHYLIRYVTAYALLVAFSLEKSAVAGVSIMAIYIPVQCWTIGVLGIEAIFCCWIVW